MPMHFKYILITIVFLSLSLAANAEVMKGDFTLEEPMAIERIQVYRDGGTIGVLLKDHKSSELKLCFDYRMMSKTHGRIFVGCIYPNDNTELVPSKSELENKILSILTDLIESHRDGSRLIAWEGFDNEQIESILSLLEGYINKLRNF